MLYFSVFIFVILGQYTIKAQLQEENCLHIRDCTQLIDKFKSGEILKDQLDVLKCGSEKLHYICEKEKPLTSDSPKYLPSGETEGCGEFSDSSNIIGGKNTKPGKYPFTVALGSADSNVITYVCGGSLINRWYVLTAAHCEYKVNKANIGDWDLSRDLDVYEGMTVELTKNQVIDIERWIVHQDYELTDRSIKNDIALVKLNKIVEVGLYVEPICLPLGPPDLQILNIPDFEDSLLGVRAHAVGWGLNSSYAGLLEENESRFATAIQQVVDLPILGKSKCLEYHRFVNYSNQVCAGGESDKDACTGDSGGPLAINQFNKKEKFLIEELASPSKWYLYGIVSAGSGKCGSETPTVFTRVTAYIGWIKENLR
ncbi:melanization protease 1 [Eurytemora carolleeae]|uniref:melanization protease 1 n=1 Tax=Eurytemora carolleeae TaxID=1294199 RepID=UPI000C7625BE|nr:melanization protease 1 [Eurytemora carolleeae]|eukprot:XP_023321870.1 melanization protease 1-like [Eurytemora affinis]